LAGNRNRLENKINFTGSHFVVSLMELINEMLFRWDQISFRTTKNKALWTNQGNCRQWDFVTFVDKMLISISLIGRF